MDNLFSPSAVATQPTQAEKNVQANHLTSVWGAEPRPGEATYTVGKKGKRILKRPSIQALRLPFGTPTEKRSVAATLAPLVEEEEQEELQNQLNRSSTESSAAESDSGTTIRTTSVTATSDSLCACLKRRE